MIRALGAKNKLCFIDDFIPVPDVFNLNRSAWERCNHLIHSWIFNSVYAPIAQTIVLSENVINVRHDLKERFAKTDCIRISTLRSSLNNLKQGSKSVLDYFTEIKGLWEELNTHRPMPTCLNDSFSVVKIQVLLMEPLHSINRMYSIVIQEE
ncbi:integrase catalytic region, partial [Trifolium medium]|nr:integrase catalytic region [Trifolium medium]